VRKREPLSHQQCAQQAHLTPTIMPIKLEQKTDKSMKKSKRRTLVGRPANMECNKVAHYYY
jgi:hypothetical protein